MLNSIRKRFTHIFNTYSQNNSIQRTSSFLNNEEIISLLPFIKEMEDFNSDLKAILNNNKGVRKWEYGKMFYSLPSFKNQSVLDIGSGPSYLPLFLSKKRSAKVTVLDLPQPFTIEYEKLEARFITDEVILKAGDMREMPFENDVFDFVISISVIEHLSHSKDHTNFVSKEVFITDTKKTLKEMFRVLKPGGWLYLTSDAYIPGKVTNDNWAGKLLNGNPYGAYSIDEVESIFYLTLLALGAVFPFPMNYEKSILISNSKYSSYRNRYMTVFNLFAQKPLQID